MKTIETTDLYMVVQHSDGDFGCYARIRRGAGGLLLSRRFEDSPEAAVKCVFDAFQTLLAFGVRMEWLNWHTLERVEFLILDSADGPRLSVGGFTPKGVKTNQKVTKYG